jgi:hypothetical protein
MSGILGALLGSFPVGAAGAFESIATATPNGVSSVTFSSIPSTYQHLQLRIIGFAATASDSAVQMTFNNDSAGNYTYHRLKGTGTAVSADGGTLQQYIFLGDSTLGITTTNPYVYIVDIHDYKSTTKNKNVRIMSGSDRNGTGVINLNSGLWLSTAAINRIDVAVVAAGDNFATGTTIALYGIKGA